MGSGMETGYFLFSFDLKNIFFSSSAFSLRTDLVSTYYFLDSHLPWRIRDFGKVGSLIIQFVQHVILNDIFKLQSINMVV